MSATDVRTESRKDPEQIAREIDTTRANLGETLDALQARLSPGQLLDQAMSMFRGHSGEFARNLGTQVKENPLPVALIGTGIAWMIASRRRGSRETIRQKAGTVRQKAAAARERVAQAGSSIAQAGSSLANTGSDFAHRVGSAAGSARAQAARAGEGFGRMMDEQPLVVAALGVALGAVIGAMLPSTEREDRLLGEASDRTKERAKELGAEQYERAREKVKEGTQTVRDALSASSTDSGGSARATQGSQESGASSSPPPQVF